MQEKKKKRKDLIRVFLSVLSLIVVILSTLTFASKKPITTHTFSNIGSEEEYRRDFIVWGITTAVIFVYYLRNIYKFAFFENSFALSCLIYSGASLFLTVLTPSNTILYPLLGRLHIFFSIAFSVLIILSVSIFLNYLSRNNISNNKHPIRWMFSVVFISLLAMVIFGWNGMFEFVFFISFAVFIFVLDLFVHNHMDVSDEPIDSKNQNNDKLNEINR